MTLDQLLAFEAVVKSGSFRSASKTLYVSQPSVSMSIKKLEEEFNVLFFSRDGYRPELTSEGKAFYEKVQSILEEKRSLEKLGRQLSEGEPEIKISINNLCRMSSVFALLKNFFDQHPKTQLTLSFEALGGAMERLVEDDVDLALTTIFQNPMEDLEIIYMTDVTIIPVCAVNYLRTEKREKLTQKLLTQGTQVLLADTSLHIEPQSSGVLRNVTKLTVNDLSIKKELILTGLGWGGLPEHSIKDQLKAGNLEKIDFAEIKSRVVPIYAIRKKRHHIGPITAKLWNYVKEVNW